MFFSFPSRIFHFSWNPVIKSGSTFMALSLLFQTNEKSFKLYLYWIQTRPHARNEIELLYLCNLRVRLITSNMEVTSWFHADVRSIERALQKKLRTNFATAFRFISFCWHFSWLVLYLFWQLFVSVQVAVDGSITRRGLIFFLLGRFFFVRVFSFASHFALITLPNFDDTTHTLTLGRTLMASSSWL